MLAHAQSKDSDFTSGSCGTPLSAPLLVTEGNNFKIVVNKTRNYRLYRTRSFCKRNLISKSIAEISTKLTLGAEKITGFFGGSLTVNKLRFGRICCWMNCNWVLSGNCERYIHVYSEHWMVMSILGKIIIVLDFLYLPVNHLIV